MGSDHRCVHLKMDINSRTQRPTRNAKKLRVAWKHVAPDAFVENLALKADSICLTDTIDQTIAEIQEAIVTAAGDSQKREVPRPAKEAHSDEIHRLLDRRRGLPRHHGAERAILSKAIQKAVKQTRRKEKTQPSNVFCEASKASIKYPV